MNKQTDELADIAAGVDPSSPEYTGRVEAGLTAARARGRKRREDAPRDEKGRILSRFYETSERRAAARAERKQKRSEQAAINEANAAKISRWNRMREVITALAMDPRLSTQMGRMFLLGQPLSITARQFEAGRRYANLLAAYDAIVLDASRSARAINPDSAGGRPLNADPDPEQIAYLREQIIGCENALLAAQESKRLEIDEQLLVQHKDSPKLSRVVALRRSGVLLATQRLVRGEELLDLALQAASVHGLDALVTYWHLNDIEAAKIRGFGEKAVFDVDGRVREWMIVREADA